MIRNHSRHGSRFPITLGGGGGYSVAKSLRFRSSASAYLSRTPATATNRTTWTWSGWVKRGALTNGTSVFGTQSAVGGVPRASMGFTSDAFDMQFNPTGAVWSVVVTTSQVFRDPAAWYHFVIAIDTTQGTASDRLKFYVNGSQVTAFSTATYPTASLNLPINLNQAHQICADGIGTSAFDGELAEVNFIDGQALAPTAFGASSIYNQWLPKKYAGTYGTNGFYLPFSGGTATSYAGSFNGSTQYLTVPNDAAFTLGATSTTEAWIYVTSTTNNKRIITNGSNTNSFDLGLYNSTNTVFVAGGNANTTASIPLNTWTHVAVVFNSGTLTIYFNGVSQALSGVTTGYSLVASTLSAVFIGAQNAGSYFPGYISNLRVVKGTAVYTANFIPPTAALTAVTNTSLLTLQNATIVDNSTNAFTITNTGTVVTSVQSPFLNPTVLTADSSGNANNWTPNNISLTAGSTYDSLTDVPTLTSTTVANYPVLSPLSTYNGGGTLSNGNLTVSLFDSANNKPTMATDTGKWYAEFTCVSAGGYSGTGLTITTSGASTLYPPTLLRTDYTNNGQTYSYNASAYVSYGASWTSGDVIGVAWDCSAAQVTFYKNGVSQGAISSPTLSLTASGTPFSFIPSSYNTAVTSSFSVNYGQQPWKYSIPSGFLPLNTFNI